MIMDTSHWHKTPPLIFNKLKLTPIDVTAKISASGKVFIKTIHRDVYKSIQRICYYDTILFFHSQSNRKSHIKSHNLRRSHRNSRRRNCFQILNQRVTVKKVKRFGSISKPMPTCLIISNREMNLTDIYEISDNF